MASLTLNGSKAQYERGMKKLGMRKNIKDFEWKYIKTTIARRREAGKESVVLVDGTKLSGSKVDREMQRHSFESVFDRIKRRNIPPYQFPLPGDL